MTTIKCDEKGQYQLIDICKYKIYICNKIDWYIKNMCVEYFNLNELYKCHKIAFKNNKLYYPSRSMCQIDITKQKFTIHHFIYYLITEAVKVIKRNSKRFTDYDILDLMGLNIKNAYELHESNLVNKLYDYLYPTCNFELLPLTYIIFKKLFKTITNSVYGLKNLIYLNFTKWNEHDLIYNLNYELENSSVNEIHLIENEIHSIQFIGSIIIENENNNCYTLEELKSFIRLYEQRRAEERLKLYEEELILKTWHPSRVIDWCFDIEDKNDFEPE